MAAGRLLGNLKDKMRDVYNSFFFDEDAAPAPRRQEEAYTVDPYNQQRPAQPAQQFEAPAPQTGMYQQPQQQTYQAPQQAYQQPQPAYQQQAYQAPQQAYQQPQQQTYQAPQQPQQGYQPRIYQNQAYASQPEAQPRNRRAQHNQQGGNNVVDFNAYQHGQAAYAPAAQQGQRFQQQPPAAEPQPAPAAASLASTRIINARGMGEVRSAITLLRNGDCVLIVLENVSDPAEMRRLVDTLSGACYSLVATITKVSRYGVYLLAPQSMAVFADQTTNQMNGMPSRQPGRPGAPLQRPGAYPQQPAVPQNVPSPYAASYANPQGFAQRTAAPMEAGQPFYTRPAPASAQAPAFSAQAAGEGYAPDESTVAQ